MDKTGKETSMQEGGETKEKAEDEDEQFFSGDEDQER